MTEINGNSPLSLLIVEDDPDLLDILKYSLSSICNNAFTATNGKEALSVIQTNPNLCAVLSDIDMPEMSGLELLANVRSSFNPIPFVVLTSHGDTKNYREAIRLNATDFLSKPFDRADLLQVMSRALEYGYELIKIEKEIESQFKPGEISAEKIEALKRAKRTAMAMRVESSLYTTKFPAK